MRKILSNPTTSAVVAFVLLQPAMILNRIANTELEPFFTFFKIGTQGGFWANPIGYLSVIFAVLLLPVGAAIAISPMLKKAKNETRSFYLINSVLATFILLFFLLVSWVLITDVPWRASNSVMARVW